MDGFQQKLAIQKQKVQKQTDELDEILNAFGDDKKKKDGFNDDLDFDMMDENLKPKSKKRKKKPDFDDDLDLDFDLDASPPP